MTDITSQPLGGSPFDSLKQVRADGTEFWSARELCTLMGYSTWQKFENPLNRAMATAVNQGHDTENLFTRSVKVSGQRGPASADFELSRFAAYLVAMNGDPNMRAVAAAQAYFAIQTRVAETTPAATELSRMQILQMALDAETENLALKAKVTEDAPKVEYVKTYVADEDLIIMSTIASRHDIREKQLRGLLRARDWIFLQTSSRWSGSKGELEDMRRWSEYADYKPYFRRVMQHHAPRFKGEVNHSLKVTPQGAEAITRLIERSIKEFGDIDAAVTELEHRKASKKGLSA